MAIKNAWQTEQSLLLSFCPARVNFRPPIQRAKNNMDVFRRLRALKDFEREHLRVLATVEDHNLVREIGFHQAGGTPLTLKQLFLLDIGSVATVQRRLRRMRQLGVVQQRRAQSDRRAVELMLTPKYLKVFRKYGELMSEQPAYRHVCGIYGDDDGLH